MADKDKAHEKESRRDTAGTREARDQADKREREKKGDEPEPNAGIMGDINPDPVPGHPNPVETPPDPPLD